MMCPRDEPKFMGSMCPRCCSLVHEECPLYDLDPSLVEVRPIDPKLIGGAVCDYEECESCQ